MTNSIVQKATMAGGLVPAIAIGGVITLPAGGPFIIHKVFGNMTIDAPTINEGLSGTLLINSVSGDIEPNPAPAQFPLIGPNMQSSVTIPAIDTPTNFFDVNWTAMGKSQLQFSAAMDSGVTNPFFAMAGILFGDAIPEVRPNTFVAKVTTNVTAAGEFPVGTITLSERATRITGVLGQIAFVGTPVGNQGIMGSFRLDSTSMKLQPAEFPMSNSISGDLNDITGGTTPGRFEFIPVDIPVLNGAIINVIGDLLAAVNGTMAYNIWIAYE